MDSISQAALGRAVVLATLGRRTAAWKAALWGAAAGTLPDLDALYVGLGEGELTVAQVAGVGFKPFEQGPCGGRFIAMHAGAEVETAGRVPGGGRLDGYHGPSVEGGQRAVVPAGLAHGGLPPAQESPGIMGPMRREEGEPCRVHEA